MPMKEFHIKQTLFDPVADSYKIRCNGVDVYQVKGKGSHFQLGSDASFQTMDGTELAYLKQTMAESGKKFPWKSFEWLKGEMVWATAHQAKSSYWGVLDKKAISVDIPGENDYKITGDRFAWKFEVFEGNKKVADIDKKFAIGDHYGVRVYEGANEVNVLLCGILVDLVYHSSVSQREPPEFDKRPVRKSIENRTSVEHRMSVEHRKSVEKR